MRANVELYYNIGGGPDRVYENVEVEWGSCLQIHRDDDVIELVPLSGPLINAIVILREERRDSCP